MSGSMKGAGHVHGEVLRADAARTRCHAPRGPGRGCGRGADATRWLLRRREIRSLGVDTLSIDPGNSTTFDTHLILTGADRYGLENLASLDRLPRRGATVVVGLIPYEQGSGGQARIFASW
jgi:kynurenine formamidase